MLYKIKKIFKNTGQDNDIITLIRNINWLTLDRVIRMGGGIFVNAAVSRYLGPEAMGKWDTALAFMGIYVVFSTLGSERLLVRDLVNTEEVEKSMGTAMVLRLVSALFFTIICAFTIYSMNISDTEQVIIGVLVSLGIFFQASDIFVYFFQARLLSKRIVQTKTIAFGISSLLKVILILTDGSLYAFVATYLVDMILSAGLLVYVFQKYEGKISTWRFSKKDAQKQLKEGMPLLVSGLAYMIYVRADQLMISEMLTKEDVGVYSRAVKLYEIPMAIYTIFAATLFPKLTSLFGKNRTAFIEGYQLSATLMTLIAYVGLALTWFLGQYVILFLYGDAYQGAVGVLNVLMIGVIFLYNAGQRGNYLLLHGYYRVIVINAVVSAMLNICLNYLLIPRYGILGAAWASVITQFFVLELSNLFFKPLREVFFIQLKAVFLLSLKKYLLQIKKNF